MQNIRWRIWNRKQKGPKHRNKILGCSRGVMNIFILCWVVDLCAHWHFDKHVVKMILELAQLLSCAHHVLDPKCSIPGLYRKTHVNHPCSQWVRAHRNNYLWTASLGLALCREYSARYGGKVHKTQALLEVLSRAVPRGIAEWNVPKNNDNPFGVTFPVPQAMPESMRHNDMNLTCFACGKTVRVAEMPICQTETDISWMCVSCHAQNETHIPHLLFPDVTIAYQTYYRSEDKAHLANWKHGQIPQFMQAESPQKKLKTRVNE